MTRVINIRVFATIVLCGLATCSLTVGTALATPKGELVNKEGKALVKNKFKSSFGEIVLETVGGTSIKCTSGTGTGTITSTTKGSEVDTLVGCESGKYGSCHSVGAETRVIVIEQEVTQLRGVEHMFLSMKIINEYECERMVGVGHLSGTYLVPVPSEGKLATKYTFTASQKGGVQNPTEYRNAEGETVKHTLELRIGGSELFEQAGVAGKQEITFEEEAEFV